MHRSLPLLASALVCVIGVPSLGACGDTRDTLDPYGPGGIDATLANATCTFFFDCCNGTERLHLGGGFGDFSTKDECIEYYSQSLRRSYWAVEDGEAAGRLEWDREKAQGCFENLETAAAECNAELYYDASGEGCTNADLIEGLVDDGDDCFSDIECATAGGYCEVDNGDADDPVVTLRGECEPPLEEGDDCIDEDVACAPNLYCNFVDDECQAYRGLGQSCDGGEQCDPENTYCGVDGTDVQCVSKKDNGEECFLSIECKSDICDGDECAGFIQNNDIDVTYEICTGEP